MTYADHSDKNVHNDVHHQSSVYVTVSGALPAHLPPPAAHFPQIAPIYLFATLSHTSIRPFYPFLFYKFAHIPIPSYTIYVLFIYLLPTLSHTSTFFFFIRPQF